MPVSKAPSRLNANRSICVSVHDVAPATWPACERLLRAVREVADIPLTLLVVPHYHHLPDPSGGRYEQRLNACRAAGHELALHGYTHLDNGPPAAGWRARFQRHLFTRREGEFSALPAGEARRRLAQGVDWFAAREWPLDGFVAPAWLLSAGAWQALGTTGFSYTTTLTHFHFLPGGAALWSPSLVYSSRNALLRRASRRWNTALARRLRGAPLVRLSLHPPDVLDGRTTRHWQRLLEELLADRAAMTKSQFARTGRSRRDAGEDSERQVLGRRAA
jgi:predicted deacetylase